MSKRIISFEIPFVQGRIIVENGSVRKHTWRSKRHCNADFELHVILHGECVLDVEDQQYPLQAGQGILIAPGKYHKPSICPGEFERFSLTLSISDGPLLQAIKEAVPQNLCFSPPATFIDLCNRIVEESAYNHPFREKAQEALLTLLAIELIRHLQLVKDITPNRQKEENLTRTDLIDNYFERCFASNSGCAALAEQLHLSTRQLDRVLKEHYGMGFKEKLIQTRMDHAALLLRTTDKRVQDIMGMVGYNSINTFYKAFRRQFSATPQQYRQLYRG